MTIENKEDLIAFVNVNDAADINKVIEGSRVEVRMYIPTGSRQDTVPPWSTFVGDGYLDLTSALFLFWIAEQSYYVREKESLCGKRGNFFYTSLYPPVQPITTGGIEVEPHKENLRIADTCLKEWESIRALRTSICKEYQGIGVCAVDTTIAPTHVWERYNSFQVLYKLPYVLFDRRNTATSLKETIFFKTPFTEHKFLMHSNIYGSFSMNTDHKAIPKDMVAQILMGSKTGVSTLEGDKVLQSIWSLKTKEGDVYTPSIFKGVVGDEEGSSYFFTVKEYQEGAFSGITYLREKIKIGFRNDPKECFYVVKWDTVCSMLEDEEEDLSYSKEYATLDKVGVWDEADEALCANLLQVRRGGDGDFLDATTLLEEKKLTSVVLKLGAEKGKYEQVIEHQYNIRLVIPASTTHANVFTNVQIISEENPDFEFTGQYAGIYRIPKIANKEIFKTMLSKVKDYYAKNAITQEEFTELTNSFGDTQTECLSVCITSSLTEDDSEIVQEECFNKLVKFGVLGILEAGFTGHDAFTSDDNLIWHDDL